MLSDSRAGRARSGRLRGDAPREFIVKTIARVALVCATFGFALGCGNNKTAGSGSSGTTHGTGATGASGASTAAASGTSGSTAESTSGASTSGSTAGSTTAAASTGSSAASIGSTSTTGSTTAASTGSSAASTSSAGSTAGSTAAASTSGSTAAASTGSTGTTTTTTGTSGTTGGCPTPGADRFYVDASASPSGNGSQQCPFTTITEGLSAASASPASAVTVQVEPGNYDANLGEVFPLVVPAKVKVTGDTPAASSRNAFVIDGSGPLGGGVTALTVGVVLMGEIDYMLIQDSNPAGNDPDAIVYSASGTPHLSLVSVDGKNTVTAAVLVTSAPGGTSPTLTMDTQCVVQNSDSDGIRIEAGTGIAPTATITGTLVHDNNNDGVHIVAGSASNPTVNLDGTTSANFFFCNGDYGVEAAVEVDARANSWDHDANALTDGSGGNGPPADVNDFAIVDTSNAVAPSANACNQ